MSTPVYLSKDYQRMWDLVRHQRAELHDAGLITQEEYGELVCAERSAPGAGSPSAKRLASYDDLRAALAEMTKQRDATLGTYAVAEQRWKTITIIAARDREQALYVQANYDFRDALTEARRVLREVEWDGQLVDDGYEVHRTCPVCNMANKHDAKCALAAVLAQEEK